MYEFLKNVPLFENLPEPDLEQLCQMLTRVQLKAGEELFPEGSVGDQAYIIESGELAISKASGNRNVLLAVRGQGSVIGEMALVENRPRMASVRAHTDVTLLAIHRDQLRELLRTSQSAAEAMFYTILERLRNTESTLRHSEKMVQLGRLSAGIAHELNNPAAAVKRGAEQLQSAMNNSGIAYIELSHRGLSDEQWQSWEQFTQRAQEQATKPPELDALARSDREYELEGWLEDLGLDDAWELAPTLVNLNLNDDELSELADQFGADKLVSVIQWLTGTYTTYSLFAELRQGAERISSIVKALKTYSYLDQAPVQAVDIHQGLDDTLLILSHKLKTGPSVKREYSEELPIVNGFGSELNQVWTNIIDNACDAVAGKPPGEGLITIRTGREGDQVFVEIEDNGPGIAPDVMPKLFEPFFTTKPPGAGTGLGLDISYGIIVHKHRGDIQVESQPGSTVFRVLLPINFEGGPEPN